MPNTQIKKMIYGLIIFYLIYGFLMDGLGFPRALLYFGDVINAWIFLNAVNNYTKNKNIITREAKMQFVIILLFFIVVLIGVLINVNIRTIPLFLWGARNTFRYYLFFFSCLVYLRKHDVDNIVAIMYRIMFINIPVCFYQFKILGLKGDYVGGLFGMTQGVNGRMNVFICILTAYYLVRFLRKESSYVNILSVILFSFCITVLSEIKIYYFEFFVIAILTIIYLKFSFRKVVICIIAGMTIMLSANALNYMYDYTKLNTGSNNFFDLNTIVFYTTKDTGYVGTGDLNRFNALAKIGQMFFDDNISKLFGMGLGNADTSNVSIFNSTFYEQYNYLHYQWFSNAFVFIETGYLGLSLYISFFLMIYFKAIRIKRNNPSEEFYSIFAQLLVIICLINMIYNISLRVESSAYLLFLLLTSPYLNNANQLD
ncbi:MAG: hypothetical protein AB9836_14360 [Aminipila sp.]